MSPFVGREIAKFLRPALKRVERRGIGAFLGSFFFAFLIGLFLGYRYVLPLVIDTALRFGTGYEQPFLTVSSYINVCLGILIFSGLMVEIPIAMSHLSAWGWIKASVWAKGRRISIVVNAVVSAILSPPDAMSMVLMMIPLQFLYESGIWGARVAEWWFYARSRNHREIATP